MNNSKFKLWFTSLLVLAVVATSSPELEAQKKEKFDFAKNLLDLKWIVDAEKLLGYLNDTEVETCDDRDSQHSVVTDVKQSLTNLLSNKPDFWTNAWTREEKRELASRWSKMSIVNGELENKKTELASGKCFVFEKSTKLPIWTILKLMGRLSTWQSVYKKLTTLDGKILDISEPLLTAASASVTKIVDNLSDTDGTNYKLCTDAATMYWAEPENTLILDTSNTLHKAKAETNELIDLLTNQEETPDSALHEAAKEVTRAFVAVEFRVKEIRGKCIPTDSSSFEWPHENIGMVEAYGETFYMLDHRTEGVANGPALLTIPDIPASAVLQKLFNVPNLPPVTTTPPASTSNSGNARPAPSPRTIKPKKTKKTRKRIDMKKFLSDANMCEQTAEDLDPAQIVARPPPNMTLAIESGFGSLRNQFESLNSAVNRIAEILAYLTQAKIFGLPGGISFQTVPPSSTNTQLEPTVQDGSSGSTDGNALDEPAPSNMRMPFNPPPFVTPMGPSNLVARSREDNGFLDDLGPSNMKMPYRQNQQSGSSRSSRRRRSASEPTPQTSPLVIPMGPSNLVARSRADNGFLDDLGPSNMKMPYRSPPFVIPMGPSNLVARPHENQQSGSSRSSRRQQPASEPTPQSSNSVFSDLFSFLSGGTEAAKSYKDEIERVAMEEEENFLSHYEMPQPRYASMTSSAMSVPSTGLKEGTDDPQMPAALTMPSKREWGKTTGLEKESSITNDMKAVLNWVTSGDDE